MRYVLIFLFSVLLIPFTAFSQENPLLDHWFYPNKGLPKQAQNVLFQDSLSLDSYRIHQPRFYHTPLFNQLLSAQYQIQLENLSEEFTITFWLLNHVNEPIGFEINTEADWQVGYWDKSIRARSSKLEFDNTDLQPWQGYWTHLVLTTQDGKMSIFSNGKELANFPVTGKPKSLFLQAHFANEPYMELDNLIKHLAVYPKPFTREAIEADFEQHQNLVLSGNRFPSHFHFLAEPYLFPIDSTRMQITFEASKASSAKIRIGEKLPLQKEYLVAANEEDIFSVIIEDLRPETAYFYQVLIDNENGESLNSGILTFKTSPSKTQPIVFGVVSDTEARPQINELIGLKLWDERPDFVLHMGDVTDGGKENDKWQWTQEYFPGVSALTTRIPMVPVPGNGEGDLFWYNRYHPQAKPGGFYKMESGVATFFILNSNEVEELQPGGKQYEWLKDGLSNSKSKWNFVAMHHAPYSADEDDYGDTWKGQSTHGDRRFQPLIRLLESNKIDILFFGHLHTYMRSFPLREEQLDEKKGIHFIQVGGMGGNLEDFAPNRVWFAAKTYRGFHYGTVSLTPQNLDLRIYNTEGAILDRLQLSK